MAISDFFKLRKNRALYGKNATPSDVNYAPVNSDASVTGFRTAQGGMQQGKGRNHGLNGYGIDGLHSTAQGGMQQGTGRNHGLNGYGIDGLHSTAQGGMQQGTGRNHGLNGNGIDGLHSTAQGGMQQGTGQNHGLNGNGIDGLHSISEENSEEPLAEAENPLSGTDYEQYYDVYQALLNTLSLPQISNQEFDAQGLYELLTTILRPAIDQAIAGRIGQSEANIAELEADAFSRGMGGSTYLSSMHQRELMAAQSDISELESQYASAIAQQLYNAMQEHYDRQLEIEMFNIEQQAQANEDALDYWWDYVQQQEENNQGSGGGGGRSLGGGAKDAEDEEASTRFDEYIEALSGFSSNVINNIFTDESSTWQDLRDSMIAEIGLNGYFALYEHFVGRPHSQAGGLGSRLGGVSHWLN